MESTFKAFDPQRIIDINKSGVGRAARNHSLAAYMRECINATAARVYETNKLHIEQARDKAPRFGNAGPTVSESPQFSQCSELEIKKEVVLALLAWATN